jgi:SdpC family antimicrobial peptide
MRKHESKRLWRGAVAVGLLAGLVMSQSGCGAADGSDPTGTATGGAALSTAAAPTHAPYDGETILKGIFLGQGPVAKLLPEVWDNPEVLEMRDEARRMTPAQMADRFEASAGLLRSGGDAEHADQLVGMAGRLRAGTVNPDDVTRAMPELDEAAGVQALLDSVREADPQFFTRFAADMQSGDHLRLEGAMVAAADMLMRSSPIEVGTPGKERGKDCFYPVVGVAVAVGYVAVWAVAAVAQVAAIYNVRWLWSGRPKPRGNNGSPACGSCGSCGSCGASCGSCGSCGAACGSSVEDTPGRVGGTPGAHGQRGPARRSYDSKGARANAGAGAPFMPHDLQRDVFVDNLTFRLAAQ